MGVYLYNLLAETHDCKKLFRVFSRMLGRSQERYVDVALYTLFELVPAPNFGGNEWPNAQRVLLKRHLLMHPKTPADLEVSDSSWKDFRTDIAWLMEQFFNFLSLLQKKHDG